jgi:hypothetical protein
LKMNPVVSGVLSVVYLIGGRLHFQRERVGEEFIDEGGQRFRVFRAVVCDPRPGQPEKPGAVFVPHFHTSNMTVSRNIAFSWFPMWFIMGLPGFRSKCWMVDDKTGDFSGYYEWDTVADAEAYGNSFAARFMINRSTPGSVWFNTYAAEEAPKAPEKK